MMKKLSTVIHRALVLQIVIILSVALVSCRRRSNVTQFIYDRTPLVEVNGQFLFLEDLKQVLPLGISAADSAVFAERYIRNWIQDVLFYENAVRNIPDTKEIDRLVENYRRSLIEHEFQRRLIDQKYSSEITDEDIEQFYNDNTRLFELDESLMKGLFLQISNRSHDLSTIRKLYTQMDDESFEEVEKYSIRNAGRCEFFYDNWRTVKEIEVLLPPMDTPLETLLSNEKSFEFKDEEYIYLLNVSEFAPKGGIEPLEHAKARIRGLLINSNEVSYMRKIKEDLYDAALDKDRIIFYYKNKK